MRDAQLASFLVTSVDNNIFFGAALSSVTKKKEKKKRRQDNSINHQYFHVPYLSKVLQLQQSVKSPIAKIQLLSCPFQDSEKRQEGG